MTGLGICQIRPSSPPGAVSWAMAKPCVAPSLITASTVHSGSDSVGHPLMDPSLDQSMTAAHRSAHLAGRVVGPAGGRAPGLRRGDTPVTGKQPLDSLFVTS